MKKTPSIAFYPAHPERDITNIMVYVRFCAHNYKHTIGISVKPKDWDSVAQKVMRSDCRYAEYNQYLNRYYKIVERLLRNERITIDARFWEDVEYSINGEDSPEHKEDTFLCDYINKVFIPRNEQRMDPKRISRFHRLVDILLEFQRKKCINLQFKDITLKFYSEFRDWFLGKEYTGNYFGTIVKLIKQVMTEAYRIDNLHQNTQYMMSEFKIVTNTVDAVYLTPEEINAIYAVKINEQFVKRYHPNVHYGMSSIIKTYQLTKDRFLIGCGTGLRISDYNSLRPENIQDGKLVVIAQKTKQRVVIPLSSMVKEILKDYDYESKLSEQRIRYYIKDICQAAGIDSIIEIRKDVGGKIQIESTEKYKLVSTHTARRSFATNAYKAGIPALQICKLTGHTSERALLNYIKISNEENAEILANNAFFQ